MNKEILKIYNFLLNSYGNQGWWPLIDKVKSGGVNPTKTGSINGYIPNDYSYPKNEIQKFEIIVGSVLAQNTSWPNAEKAVYNLYENDLLNPNKLKIASHELVSKLIKPAGYFNQKAERLILIAEWFSKLDYIPSRTEVLNLKGVGPETADCILLYAFKQNEFVIDTYTKRILLNLNLIDENSSYNDMKNLFEENLKSDWKVFQEFHALLVEHAKRFHIKKGMAEKDPLKELIFNF